MKKFLSDLVQRLTSRKFLAALGTGLVLAANQQWGELVAVATAYIASEGIGDVAERYGTTKAVVAQTQLEDTKLQVFGPDAAPDGGVDRSQLVPGASDDMTAQ